MHRAIMSSGVNGGLYLEEKTKYQRFLSKHLSDTDIVNMQNFLTSFFKEN